MPSDRPGQPGEGSESPARLDRGSWRAVLKRTAREVQNDRLTDSAAALTYYGVLSIFPGLLVLVSVLGLLSRSFTDSLVTNIGQVAPGAVKNVLGPAIANVQHQGSAGLGVGIGLLGAFWSASAYVAAFMRFSNTIYDVPEGRPIWKTLPIRIAVTAAIGTLLVLGTVIVVVTGRIAQQVGRTLGIGSTAVTIWGIVKWPVLLAIVSLIFGILYWAAPNARHGGFRWVSPGGVVAVVLWLIASGVFAVYVANFSSYNKTYGALATPIIFLIWLWISNVAILLGAEFDAELQRQRAIATGTPPDREPYLPLRDTRKLDKGGDGEPA